jgi:hypothetical protein
MTLQPLLAIAPLAKDLAAMPRLLLSIAILLVCKCAWAQCCDHCGCDSSCEKVCRVICEIKKVPKVTYDCECEDVCVPGPSCCTVVCDECGNKKKVFTPTCGKVYTKTKVVKHEELVDKVTYRWVVETLCCGCSARCAAADRAAAAANPELAARRGEASPAGLSLAPPPAPLSSAAEARQVGFEQAPSNSDAAADATAEAAPSGERKFDLRRLFGVGR